MFGDCHGSGNDAVMNKIFFIKGDMDQREKEL